MRRSDFIVIACISFLIIYWMLSLFLGDLNSPVIALYDWIIETSLLLGYPGTLFVSFFGNATIIFPFPYIGLPFILGGLRDIESGAFLFDPWIVGFLSGLGAIIGEMTGYYIGYGGSHFIEEEKMNRFRAFIERYPQTTPLVIWLLAVTPSPDDVLIVPLGAIRYTWWKVFIPGFIGKTMLLTGVAWAGRFGLDWIAAFVNSTGSGNIISLSIEILGLLIIIVFLYLVIRIDWKNFRTTSKTELAVIED
jgi:membrane protein YqaA with SNARE-associated domain